MHRVRPRSLPTFSGFFVLRSLSCWSVCVGASKCHLCGVPWGQWRCRWCQLLHRDPYRGTDTKAHWPPNNPSDGVRSSHSCPDAHAIIVSFASSSTFPLAIANVLSDAKAVAQDACSDRDAGAFTYTLVGAHSGSNEPAL